MSIAIHPASWSQRTTILLESELQAFQEFVQSGSMIMDSNRLSLTLVENQVGHKEIARVWLDEDGKVRKPKLPAGVLSFNRFDYEKREPLEPLKNSAVNLSAGASEKSSNNSPKIVDAQSNVSDGEETISNSDKTANNEHEFDSSNFPKLPPVTDRLVTILDFYDTHYVYVGEELKHIVEGSVLNVFKAALVIGERETLQIRILNPRRSSVDWSVPEGESLTVVKKSALDAKLDYYRVPKTGVSKS